MEFIKLAIALKTVIFEPYLQRVRKSHQLSQPCRIVLQFELVSERGFQNNCTKALKDEKNNIIGLFRNNHLYRTWSSWKTRFRYESPILASS